MAEALDCEIKSPDDLHPCFSTWVDVDLDALTRNFLTISEKVSPAAVIAVIKANALGFGGPVVGKALELAGVRMLAVSHFTEGLELRQHGVKAPVLVMNGLLPAQMRLAAAKDILFFVFDEESLRAAEEAGEALSRKVRVHLKVDTGMGRLGILPEQAPALKAALDRTSWVEVDGVASHLASPYREDHDRFSVRQYREFVQFAAALDPGHKAIWHFAASSGAIRFPEMYADAVRVGALLHGIGRTWPMPWPLEQAESFKAAVVQVKSLPKGHNVGYTLHYAAPSDMRVAIIPAGTLDGLTGEDADTGCVLVKGKRCRIVGICSCQMMVDVTGVSGVKPGDEVVIFGKQGSDEISAVECASLGGTSYANVTARISRRVARFYWSGGKIVAADVNGQVTSTSDWGALLG